jgi:hypothetical protein
MKKILRAENTHTLKKLAILVGVDRRRIGEIIKELRIPRLLENNIIVVDDIYVNTIKKHFETYHHSHAKSKK